MARQTTDARRDRGLPDNARPARCAGGYLRGLLALRLLGSLGGWLGADLARVRDGGTAGHGLCPPARPAVADRDHLWREPGGHRADPSILLAVSPARHRGSVSIRYCTVSVAATLVLPGILTAAFLGAGLLGVGWYSLQAQRHDASSDQEHACQSMPKTPRRFTPLSSKSVDAYHCDAIAQAPSRVTVISKRDVWRARRLRGAGARACNGGPGAQPACPAGNPQHTLGRPEIAGLASSQSARQPAQGRTRPHMDAGRGGDRPDAGGDLSRSVSDAADWAHPDGGTHHAPR